MMRALRPLARLYEQVLLRWALRELHPMHPVVPKIVRRLSDQDRAPSPLDPADTPVVGACILAALALLGMALAGWLSQNHR